MRDEQKIRIDVRMPCKFILYIFYEHFVQCTAVFLSDAHASVMVIHLDARFELQHICTEGCDGRASSACMEKCESIKYKAGVTFGCTGAELFSDRFGIHSFFDHFPGGDDSQTCSSRKVAAVYDMDVSELLSCKAAVLI